LPAAILEFSKKILRRHMVIAIKYLFTDELSFIKGAAHILITIATKRCGHIRIDQVRPGAHRHGHDTSIEGESDGRNNHEKKKKVANHSGGGHCRCVGRCICSAEGADAPIRDIRR
jgi:hypothetical protein